MKSETEIKIDIYSYLIELIGQWDDESHRETLVRGSVMLEFTEKIEILEKRKLNEKEKNNVRKK